ncbi:hypothetical protein E4K10_24010 [Streptomyces sp. T1317-0309]|nr:hypothetical protein E4K10_24010 [Streptomyces sp. T1317-0309]
MPFSFKLDRFTGTYERSGPNKGTPRTYEAAITYSVGAYGKDKKTTVRVNEPLNIGDAKVYLVSHGYAPTVTVRDGKGDIVFQGAVPLLPIDSNATSQGAVKVYDGYRNAQGVHDQLGFAAFFVPTFAGAGKGTMYSQFPGLDFPVLAVTAYHGTWASTRASRKRVPAEHQEPEAVQGRQGQQADGASAARREHDAARGNGSITFDKDIKEWAGFQVVQQPGNGWALGGALAAIFGLAGSLFIQRRRVWVRATTGPTA